MAPRNTPPQTDPLALEFLEPWFESLPEEHQISLIISTYQMLADKQSHTTIWAFEALAVMVAFCWKKRETPKSGFVPVPFWAAERIAAGYLTYKDGLKKGFPGSLGQSFGLEAQRQGAPKRVQELIRLLREIRIALQIAYEHLTTGVSIEKAIVVVAGRAGREPKSCWRVWSKYGNRARSLVADFLTRNTSGSGGSDGTN